LIVMSALPRWAPTPWPARYSIASPTASEVMLRVAQLVAAARAIAEEAAAGFAQAQTAKARKQPKLSLTRDEW
jgi:hypothetical protein